MPNKTATRAPGTRERKRFFLTLDVSQNSIINMEQDATIAAPKEIELRDEKRNESVV